MSLSQIKNPIIRRTFLVALWPVWAGLIVLLCALEAALRVWPEISQATRDCWEGPNP